MKTGFGSRFPAEARSRGKRSYRLYPRVLTGLLMNSHGSPELVYLGDVN